MNQFCATSAVSPTAKQFSKLGWVDDILGANIALVSIGTAFVALLSLLPTTSARPQDKQNSFIEFKDRQQTTTYDLRTVNLIQPGKFVIVETIIDEPDVMRFKLKVLDTLRSQCDRPVGSYPAPAETFTLGPP
jgi:hypothetical protein